jgi:outer membrane protein assembly factor BamB
MAYPNPRNLLRTNAIRIFLGFLFVMELGTDTRLSASSFGVVDEPGHFAKCWDYKTSPDLSVEPVADARSVYFLTGEKKIDAVDLKTGARVWSSELGGEVVSNLLVTDAAIFLVTSTVERTPQKSYLRSVSKQTGISNWSAEVPKSDRISLGVVNGNIVAVGFDGIVSAHNREKGERVWTNSLAVTVTAEPQFRDTEAIFGTDRKEVNSVAGSDGRVVVIGRSEYLPTAVFLDPDRRLLIGDERGNLLLTSTDGSSIWRFKNGARIAFVLQYDAEYVAASYDNFIYKVTGSGHVEWKRRLSGRIGHMPEFIGSVAIISVIGEGGVYVLNLKNGKILNRIESAEESSPRIAVQDDAPAFVVAGSRGLAYYKRDGCAPAK